MRVEKYSLFFNLKTQYVAYGKNRKIENQLIPVGIAVKKAKVTKGMLIFLSNDLYDKSFLWYSIGDLSELLS